MHFAAKAADGILQEAPQANQLSWLLAAKS
jgi:hypothetical protein